MSKKRLIKEIAKRLKYLYPSEHKRMLPELQRMMDGYAANAVISAKKEKYGTKSNLSEKDSIIITYADSIKQKGEKPLKTLHKFLKKHIKDKVSSVHILPFFPYSSDDGFSIIDYKQVNPEFGDWEDMQRLGKDYRLMADLVINHMSQKSAWFQAFLKGDRRYKDYFIAFDKEIDTSSVFRPRTHPLLTKFKTSEGNKYVWTTFSADQVDLNFKSPNLFLDMMDVLLFYFSQGIEIIRLDAIGFLWKELGTSCMHLKQTHEAVKLMRDIAEYVAPYSVIITETNVPYQDNISYFGKSDEAHMVYQFSFPPLVLDAFIRSDACYLEQLYGKLERLPKDSLFFNFLASHDGIGVLSAKEVLTDIEFDDLVNEVKKHNGLISYKSLGDGSKIPYELNINYYDAINYPGKTNQFDVQRFIASQAIIVLSKGIPGIYIHSLIGSRNDVKGAKKSGINRRINREKLDFGKLTKELSDKKSRRRKVLDGYLKLLKVRTESKSLNPFRKEECILSDKRLLILDRVDCIVVINVSKEKVLLSRYLAMDDVISGKRFDGVVKPYGVYLLKN